MNFNEFEFILDNLNVNDWIINYEGKPIVYKNDFNLSFHVIYLDEGFNESWATNHPNRNAKQARGYFYYRDNMIYEVYLAVVDGGRAILPYPQSDSNRVISRRDYNIAMLINTQLDDYLRRSNITVM